MVVDSVRKDHGAPRPEQGGTPAKEGGNHQSRLFLQSPDPGAKGKSTERPVQL